jgi:hypothetical protein
MSEGVNMNSIVKPIRLLLAPVLGVACAVGAASPSLATLITYTEQVTGTGELNNVAFTNESVVFNMNNNTTNITNAGGGIFDNIGTVTLTVGGGAPVTITDITQAVANQPADRAGFGDVTSNFALLFTGSPSLSTYALATAIGPVIGTAIFSPSGVADTTGGFFELSGVTGSATFTATIPVPEPSTWAMMLAGFAGLVFAGRRASRKSAAVAP